VLLLDNRISFYVCTNCRHRHKKKLFIFGLLFLKKIHSLGIVQNKICVFFLQTKGGIFFLIIIIYVLSCFVSTGVEFLTTVVVDGGMIGSKGGRAFVGSIIRPGALGS
jgi:hypothetical protein